MLALVRKRFVCVVAYPTCRIPVEPSASSHVIEQLYIECVCYSYFCVIYAERKYLKTVQIAMFSCNFDVSVLLVLQNVISAFSVMITNCRM